MKKIGIASNPFRHTSFLSENFPGPLRTGRSRRPPAANRRKHGAPGRNFGVTLRRIARKERMGPSPARAQTNESYGAHSVFGIGIHRSSDGGSRRFERLGSGRRGRRSGDCREGEPGRDSYRRARLGRGGPRSRVGRASARVARACARRCLCRGRTDSVQGKSRARRVRTSRPPRARSFRCSRRTICSSSNRLRRWGRPTGWRG